MACLFRQAKEVRNDVKEFRSSVHGTLDKRLHGEERMFTKIIDELKQNSPNFASHAALIVDLVKQKASGELMDDRTLLIERIIQVIARLPPTSFARRKVTEVLVEQLWDSLEHPPLTYVGDKFQYRQPDGSYNSIEIPDLGKAGTPYARTVRTALKVPEARPDPGLLFDLLMKRGDYEENQAGISSMLFYHASIITHDIFETNRQDPTINDASSYLDLSPLYGHSLEQQRKVRSFIGGQLKPDTFHEKRLLGFPPGVCVLLIAYSRFHNYVAKSLEAINAGGRFTPPRHLNLEPALAWKDEQLFQTARLITNGLYINISLHDYLRAIANVPATDSTWTLDPRVTIKKKLKVSGEGPPQGIGNHVSCEFNLLYRFHSAISDRDSKWTQGFFESALPGQDVRKVPIPVMLKAVGDFVQFAPDDPSERTFGGLQRGPDGTFNDDELVKILKESIEDPAGRFGANHVPEIFKPIEVLGIIQARKWQVASLNEFRKFFQLKPYKKFTDLNDDPYVAKTLERLYGDVDNVELYPGMFLEACKPRMDAGMGLCAPYTVTRAVFSDAITLIRGDRFLTLDYTPANLTNWGISEVQSDYDILGGAKMYTLLLNAFPNHFKFNSVYAMQPFYTPTETKKTFDKLGWSSQFSFDPPGPPTSRLIPITSHAGLRTVLADQNNFRVPWGAKMQSLESYMLAGDTPACAAQRQFVGDLVYTNNALQNFASYSEEITLKLLRRDCYMLGFADDKVYEIDVVRDIANHGATHFAAELFYLPLDRPSGVSYTIPQLYKILTDLTMYVFSDADPLRSWKRRRDGQQSTAQLCSEMEDIVRDLRSFDARAATAPTSPPPIYCPRSGPLSNYGVTFARKLIQQGKSDRECAEILVGTASALVANTATAIAQLIDFYLEPANATHWAEIQRLAKLNTDTADSQLTRYVLEGFRLSNSLGLLRIAIPQDGSNSITLRDSDGATISANRGDRIFISFVAASRDPRAFPNPNELRLDRDLNKYITFGEGPHQCLGKDLATVHARTVLKILATMDNLRRTPGETGKLKFIPKPGGVKIYLNPDWSDFTPYPTTMKLMFDGGLEHPRWNPENKHG